MRMTVTFPYVMGWRLLRWCSVWSSCGVPDGVGHPMLWSSRRGLLEAQVTFPYVMGWRLLRWCSVWSSCGVPDGVGHPMLWSSRRGLLEAQMSFLLVLFHPVYYWEESLEDVLMFNPFRTYVLLLFIGMNK
ncbi:uncharacterized protein LOC143765697 isoform X3 [Ranitomeya variabilis]|uniref:uncharacterized protein LOC143765697 isoform X3 n=1 Tax=Ranitomeya variabilis TaxID=490064 RepID=UPI0040570E1E